MKYKKLDEIIEFNPKENIAKKRLAKKIPMDNLNCFTKYIKSYSLEEYNGGMKFRNGDTLLARITPCLENGKTSKVTILDENEVGFGSTEYIVMRSKRDISDEDFIFYLAISPMFRDIAIKSMTGTSGRQRVQLDVVKNTEMLVPSYQEQVKIGKILSNIDKKIELNNQINNNLHDLGDTLYKEFYSKYENDLPKGYKYFNLNEVSVNYDSKRKPMSSREREQHKGIYPYYGATSIIDYVDSYIFNNTYLLMGEDGTVKTNEGYPVLQYIWGKNWINNHAHVLQGTVISTEHLMFALRKKNIESLITGAVQPKINQVNMNKIKVIIGTDEVNKRFEKEIKVIVTKIKANLIENETLTKLRDTLLPKLMNGEINIDNIEV